jgi:hypothetical protein
VSQVQELKIFLPFFLSDIPGIFCPSVYVDGAASTPCFQVFFLYYCIYIYIYIYIYICYFHIYDFRFIYDSPFWLLWPPWGKAFLSCPFFWFVVPKYRSVVLDITSDGIR